MIMPVFYQKSMNVTVTEFTFNVIQHDMAAFQINQNKILNTIVQNLSGESSADYLYQHGSYQILIERIVAACIKEFKQPSRNANTARTKIENLYKEQFYAEKNQPIHGHSLRFTLSKQSVEQLYSIPGIPKETLIGYSVPSDGEPGYRSVTKYLGRLFESYAKLAIKDREKCIFAENYEIIESAISERKCISVNISAQDSIKTLQIKPYKLLADIFTEYYYLVGYACDQPNGEYKIATFRVSRLNNPKKCRGDYLTPSEEFALEQRLEDVSPAYLQNKAVMVKVIMTRAGEDNYFRILRNRPNAIKKETMRNKDSDYTVKYTFFGSEFQIANYFHQFGADAVITEPRELHDEQKMWYKKAAQIYEKF